MGKYGPYKLIVGCDILHNVDMEIELRNIYRSLEKKGMTIFSEPGALNISWYIYFFLKRNWNYEKGAVNCTFFNLKKVFKNNGFSGIEIEGLGLFPRIFFQNETLCKFNDWLGNLPVLKLFAYRYIIIAYKG